MEYMPIARLSSLDNKEFVPLSILGKRIAIFKNPDGTLFVTESGCKHLGATAGR